MSESNLRPEKKNLIMGVVKNYWWYKIEPFYVSCALYNGENCDIVAFTKNLSQFTLDKLHEYRIHTVEIPDAKAGDKGPIDYRYGLYIETLKKKRDQYHQVLFCDTRDVFFQRTLFTPQEEEYLGVAVEQGRICDDEWNDRWMRERFGMEIYEKLKENNVLCAGTIWGTADVVYDFCNTMIDNLSDPNYNYIDINDQTSLNYMVYTGIVPKDAALHKSDLKTGDVATIGTLTDYRIDGDRLYTLTDNFPSLVHQWDRHKDTTKLARRVYNEKSPRIRWNRYRDYRSLKDIALSAYHDRRILTMLVASVKYLFSERPAGEHLWTWK